MTVIHSVSPKVNHLKGKGENYILGKMDFMMKDLNRNDFSFIHKPLFLAAPST